MPLTSLQNCYARNVPVAIAPAGGEVELLVGAAVGILALILGSVSISDVDGKTLKELFPELVLVTKRDGSRDCNESLEFDNRLFASLVILYESTLAKSLDSIQISLLRRDDYNP